MINGDHQTCGNTEEREILVRKNELFVEKMGVCRENHGRRLAWPLKGEQEFCLAPPMQIPHNKGSSVWIGGALWSLDQQPPKWKSQNATLPGLGIAISTYIAWVQISALALCNLGQVTLSLCASISTSVPGRKILRTPPGTW